MRKIQGTLRLVPPLNEAHFHRWSDDPKDPLYRLTVERDEDGLFTVSEEEMTSTNHLKAQVSEVHGKTVMPRASAEWLLTSLARALGAEVATEDVRDSERRLVSATVIRFTRKVEGG